MKIKPGILIVLIIALFLLLSCSQRLKVHTILVIASPLGEGTLQGFKNGMTSMGYEEGKNISYLLASGSDDNELELKARGMLGEKPELIVSITTAATRIALNLIEDYPIPLVFGQVSTLDGIGISSDEERLKRNITGITSGVRVTKQLEYLKRIAPGIKRVLLVYKPDPLPLSMVIPLKAMADKIGVELVEKHVQDADSLGKLLGSLKSGEVDAILQIPDLVVNYNIRSLTEVALRLKIPLEVFIEQDISAKGALLAYVLRQEEHGKEVADMVDKVLKGIPASKLQVEMPKRYYLTINMETASEIGLTIPPDMLSLADRLIYGNEPVR